MTLNANDVRNEYTASAGQTIFNYTFKIYESTDLSVYVTPAGQSCGPGDLTTSYTVSGVGLEDGGSITLNSATSAGDLVTIVSAISTGRTTDYQNNGDFRPDTVNDDFDRAVSLIKQVEDKANRSLQFEECLQSATSLSLPMPEDGRYMRWKANLTGLENADGPSVTVNDTDILSADDYVTVRNLEPSSLTDGQPLTVTNTGIAGDGVIRNSVAHGLTDNGGTIIVIDADWYWERIFDDTYHVKWFGAVADGTEDSTTSIQNAIDVIWERGGGELQLGDETDMYRTTSALFFRVADAGNLDKGISIVAEGARIYGDHSGRILDIQGGFRVKLDNFFLDGNGTNEVGLVCAGANNTSVTDNGGNTGSGKRSEHFDINNIEVNNCLIAAKFGDGNDQLDYTTVRNSYFRGINTGCVVEEGNTYVTFIECAAHGSTTAQDAWFINNGQAKLIDCYAFSATWAVTINGDSPMVIIGMEGENLDNGIRKGQGSVTSWRTKANLAIRDSQFFLTSQSNIGLSIGDFIGVSVENSYFGGVLDVLNDDAYLQGCFYREVNTYFEGRDALYSSCLDYEIKGGKDPAYEVSFFESNLISRSINQNLINDSATPTSMNNGTVTANSRRFKGARNAAHLISFDAAVTSYVQFRAGTELLTAGWETEIQGESLTFGIWAKLDDAEVADENTDARLWCFSGAYPGTTLARKNMKLTKSWKYYQLTVDMPATISTAITFSIRNSVASTLDINFYAPMITFKGVHNNYYETSGTAKIY